MPRTKEPFMYYLLEGKQTDSMSHAYASEIHIGFIQPIFVSVKIIHFDRLALIQPSNIFRAFGALCEFKMRSDNHICY